MPSANVGIATGGALDVLDVDGPAGICSLDELVDQYGALPPGPVATTGKGRHHYLSPTGLGNRAAVRPGIDFRGRGGYVVAPPSMHPNGARYAWLSSPEVLRLPIVPDWALGLLGAPSVSSGERSSGGIVSLSAVGTPYGVAALEREVGKVTLALPGSRNDRLNRSAFALGQLIAGGELDVDHVISGLLLAAERCGLAKAEAESTIGSGLRAGSKSPRKSGR